MATREAYSGPVEYMVTIQDPSPEVNWYGGATVWCSHKNECKSIWKRSKERPNSEYIVSEKMDQVGVGDSKDFRWQSGRWVVVVSAAKDFRWQYRRTMVDVDEGKWAVEEFRYVKDISGLINSRRFEDFGYLNVKDDNKLQYQQTNKHRALSKLAELIQHQKKEIRIDTPTPTFKSS